MAKNKRQRRERRDARIEEAWSRLEEAEPDISTERLMAMVMDDTGCSHDHLMDYIRRNWEQVS